MVHFSAVAITTAGESDCEERKWANVTKLKAAASDTFTLKQVLNSCVPTEVTVGGRLVDKSCFSYKKKHIFWLTLFSYRFYFHLFDINLNLTLS